jgi:hypothetical protein
MEVIRGRERIGPVEIHDQTMSKRIDKLGDLWQGVLGTGIDLKEWLRRLEKICG